MPDLPEPTNDIPQLPPRDPTTHKGQVGRIAIIAGSRGMSGAAVLCGLGALRGGAGLVRVFTPASVQPVVASSEPCLMVTGVAETDAGMIGPPPSIRLSELSWGDVLAIGPGLGLRVGFEEFLGYCLPLETPMVVDADALNVSAKIDARVRMEHADGTVWSVRTRPTVLTPHPGEMTRLRAAGGMPELTGTDDETRLRIAHEYAVYSGATVVLKGHRSVVCTPDRAFINTTGNPGMAAGGMGDVLTGLIAALLGRGLGAFDAARLGVYVHGLAADHAAQTIGPVGYLAREVADLIPAALALASSRPIGFHTQDQ
jgi:NAD(P)H-hydrate epimerase